MDDKNERFQLIIASSVIERVRALATKERRSVSNMIVVLLTEALRKRESRKDDIESPGLVLALESTY